jgi:hypothetical protein
MVTSDTNITQKDILYIINNPWEVTHQEWGLGTEDSVNRSLEYVKNKLTASKKDGFSKIWKTEKNEPVAILIFYCIGEKTYRTVFIAGKHMENQALKITRDLSQTILEKFKKYSDCTCGLYSGSTHPQHIKWFALLGFVYRPEENVGSLRFFEFLFPEKGLI